MNSLQTPDSRGDCVITEEPALGDIRAIPYLISDRFTFLRAKLTACPAEPACKVIRLRWMPRTRVGMNLPCLSVGPRSKGSPTWMVPAVMTPETTVPTPGTVYVSLI